MKPIEANDRIETLDYLRGFALLGIILVNILPLLSVPIPAPAGADAAYWRFLYLFVEGRFFTIFSFLFGVGFYLFLSRANAKGKNGTGLFLQRILVMFLFGLVHSMFHPGEALTVYAVSGLLVLPFYKLKKETNLIIGLVLLLIFSLLAMKPLLPIPLILLGLTAGQYRVFENLAFKKRGIAFFTVITFSLTVLALFYQYQQLPTPSMGGTNDMYPFYYTGIMIGPIVSAFYVGLLVLMLESSFVRKVLLPLKYYGRVALTNYISQTAFILLAGKWFNLNNQLTYLESLVLCVIIYAIQLLLSMIWLKSFRFGPLEWVWRIFTYLEIPPLLKRDRIRSNREGE